MPDIIQPMTAERLAEIEARHSRCAGEIDSHKTYPLSLWPFQEDRAELLAEVKRLQSEVADLQTIFQSRWDADMRAIKRWQAAYPGNDLVWPDHTDLVCWLMRETPMSPEQVAEMERQNQWWRDNMPPLADVPVV